MQPESPLEAARMANAPRRRATYDDLRSIPDHLVAEILDGELLTSPRPASPHARAGSILGAEIVQAFDRPPGDPKGPGGWWILYEPELHLGDDVVVPDFAGWRREAMPVLPNVAAFRQAPQWVLEIVSPSRYDKLLSSGTLAAGESDEAAVAVVATSGLGAGAGVAADGSGTRKLIFAGVVGGVVVALGILGVVMLRRQRPEVEEVEELVPGEVKKTVVKKKRLVQKPAATRQCPTCHATFDGSKVYCPNDGARLA